MPISPRIRKAEFDTILPAIINSESRDSVPFQVDKHNAVDCPSGLRLPWQWLDIFRSRVRSYFTSPVEGVEYSLTSSQISAKFEERGDGLDYLTIDFTVRQVYRLSPGEVPRVLASLDKKPVASSGKKRTARGGRAYVKKGVGGLDKTGDSGAL